MRVNEVWSPAVAEKEPQKAQEKNTRGTKEYKRLTVFLCLLVPLGFVPFVVTLFVAIMAAKVFHTDNLTEDL